MVMYLLSSANGERGTRARLFHGRSADIMVFPGPASPSAVRSGVFRRDVDDGTRLLLTNVDFASIRSFVRRRSDEFVSSRMYITLNFVSFYFLLSFNISLSHVISRSC